MCFAKYAPSFPPAQAKLLRSEGPSSWPELAKRIASTSWQDRAKFGTTTAIDVIHGGVKVNALPELVTALVNFRIDFAESVLTTQQHVAGILEKVATRNGLPFSAWEGKDGDKDMGGRYVTVEVMGVPLEPAPRSPTTGGVWELFAGTVKWVNSVSLGCLFDGRNNSGLCFPDRTVLSAPSHRSPRRESPCLLAPTVRSADRCASSGNTDCKMYYNLTKNVYRFMGAPAGSGHNAVGNPALGSQPGEYSRS